MSLNWVMVSPSNPDPFVKLPHERILYTSPSRTSLELGSVNDKLAWKVKSEGGVAYITNQRMVYLPTKPTDALSSFNSPIPSLLDTYVRAPFFGANSWTATVRPVPGGGIPPEHSIVELKMTFREGGAYDFHTTFELAKERLHYAAEAAREQGRILQPGEDVNLEQLPAYEAATEVSVQDGRPRTFETSQNGSMNGAESSVQTANSNAKAPSQGFQPPDEPPPGYEEAQFQAVEADFDARTRRDVERGRESGDEESDVVSSQDRWRS